MKPIFIFSATTFFLFLIPIFSLPVFAHTIQHHDTLQVVYHLHPDHSPYVGEEAKIGFMFHDKKNTFSLQNCFCTVTISEQGKIIHETNLTKEDNSYEGVYSEFSYTFPKKGLYTVTLRGKAKNTTSFTPFTFTFSDRIERERGTSVHLFSNSYLQYVLLSIILGIVLISVPRFLKLNKKQQ